MAKRLNIFLFFTSLNKRQLLTGIVGKARACAGIGCVGKEEAGKERVVLFAIDDIEEDASVEFDVVVPVAICCICPIFPRSRFCSR